jgi:uncharacterized protein (TIGR03437 family)
MVSAINTNLAPIISSSWGSCEFNVAQSAYRSIAQQANAQGITILSATGDAGAAGCDIQGAEAFAARGRALSFPAVMPEVTAVGGTQFVEGNGNYWASSNSANSGSALSYIPEAAWNENGTGGLISTGGGASVLYSRPAWQNGPTIPSGDTRFIPDVSLTASSHDGYLITYSGGTFVVSGTSASAPSFAGMIALLNQYQVANGFQKAAGLGNINPQLYRLAQDMPGAFHDVTAGDNIVPCVLGSPDCATGSYGYRADIGYDLATGLGSVDANTLVTKWNTPTNASSVRLVLGSSRVTLNDTITVTAFVTPLTGSGTPTGSINFSAGALGIALGSTPLTSRAGQGQAADLTFPAYLLGTGSFALTASYSGDAAYSGAGANASVTITLPTKGAAIIPSAAQTIWPNIPDSQGLSWTTNITLREAAGVPALITGFTIDGQPQPLAQYFPSPQILPGTTVRTTVVFRDMPTPITRSFGFTGTDATGQDWTRQLFVTYVPMFTFNFFDISATPLVVTQNTAADPSCQWAVQVNVNDIGGFQSSVTNLWIGNASQSLASQIPAIFGTTRLDAWNGLQGTFCFGGITPPATSYIEVDLSSGAAQQVQVSFAGPPANPGKITATPPSVSLAATNKQTLAVDLTDKTQSWTASVFPANRTTSWLSLSQRSGTGPAQITLTASAAGFAPGAYRANIVMQSPNAMPQTVTVPVMFVVGANQTGMAITRIANPGSDKPAASPGMLLNVYGTQLANSSQTSKSSPAAYSLAGVSATVNGVACPMLAVAPDQVTIQIPFEVGAGPAVLGINRNGEIAGFQFQLAPSSPGIFPDSKLSAAQGGYATIYVAGVGEVSPAIKSAYTTSANSSVVPKPVLPLSVTVGGIPAFVQYAAISPGLIGVAQVNFLVPANVPTGPQPVVVTVNGVASPPVNLAVQ